MIFLDSDTIFVCSCLDGEPGGNKNNLNQLKRGGTGGGGRVSGGSRGSGSRVSGGASRGSSGGVRTGSTTTYRNTRTGATIQRPPGSQWTRSALIFLPIARSYSRRSQSSSNRFTTPSSGAESYYYCTSNTDPNVEIQCSSADNDNECCEQPGTGQPFCCGGDIPDDYVPDPNRALKMFTRILYTLAALALCFYFYRRRSYG